MEQVWTLTLKGKICRILRERTELPMEEIMAIANKIWDEIIAEAIEDLK